MATSASTRRSDPSIAAIVFWRPPTRETPVGTDCAVRWMTSSGTRAATFGSARRSRFCCLSSFAEKPRMVLPKVRSALTPSRLRTLSTTAAVSVPSRSTTMYRPVASSVPAGVESGVATAGTSGSAGAASVVAPGRALGRGFGVGATTWTGFAAGVSVGGEDGLANGSLAVAGATTGRTTSTPRSRAAIRRYMPATLAVEAADAYGPLVPSLGRPRVRGVDGPARRDIAPAGEVREAASPPDDERVDPDKRVRRRARRDDLDGVRPAAREVPAEDEAARHRRRRSQADGRGEDAVDVDPRLAAIHALRGDDPDAVACERHRQPPARSRRSQQRLLECLGARHLRPRAGPDDTRASLVRRVESGGRGLGPRAPVPADVGGADPILVVRVERDRRQERVRRPRHRCGPAPCP